LIDKNEKILNFAIIIVIAPINDFQIKEFSIILIIDGIIVDAENA